MCLSLDWLGSPLNPSYHLSSLPLGPPRYCFHRRRPPSSLLPAPATDHDDPSRTQRTRTPLSTFLLLSLPPFLLFRFRATAQHIPHRLFHLRPFPSSPPLAPASSSSLLAQKCRSPPSSHRLPHFALPTQSQRVNRLTSTIGNPNKRNLTGIHCRRRPLDLSAKATRNHGRRSSITSVFPPPLIPAEDPCLRRLTGASTPRPTPSN